MLGIAVNIIKLLKMLGLPIAAAVILTVLLIESKPMSLDDLRRKTGYAKSHLSSSLRLLEEKLLIERIIGPRRRVWFCVKRDALLKLLREHFSELKDYLHSVISELEDGEYTRDLRAIEKGIGDFLEKLRRGGVSGGRN